MMFPQRQGRGHMGLEQRLAQEGAHGAGAEAGTGF